MLGLVVVLQQPTAPHADWETAGNAPDNVPFGLVKEALDTAGLGVPHANIDARVC